MTIREKVARAICRVSCTVDNCDCPITAPHTFSGAEADAAITAFLEAAAEDGWRMCRAEATEEMKHAAFLAMDNASCRGDPIARAWDCLQGHRAMVAAAPEFEWDK